MRFIRQVHTKALFSLAANLNNMNNGVFMQSKWSKAIVFLAGSLMSLSTGAVSMNCTDLSNSELPANVTVEIPAFLYFQVGSANQTPEITFDATPTLPAQGAYGGPVPPTVPVLTPTSITGSDVSNGVNVKVRANCGDVKLAYSVSDSAGLVSAEGYHIPFDALITSSDDADLSAPVLANAANQQATVTTTSYGAVTDRSTVWHYSYNKPDMPVSGVYQGTVTYQASCL